MLDKDTQAVLAAMKQSNQIWILKDEHGCVMLTAEEEDGVPVWASEADALAWANEEWSHCEALAIEVTAWKQKWTNGLQGDDLVVMINPSESQEHGVVLTPVEFDQAI